MKRVFLSKSLKSVLPVLLGISLFTWLFLPVLPAQTASAQQPTSATSCPVLPAHFDFAHASPQVLRLYHIPFPPATRDQHAVANWLKDVQGMKKIVCLPATYTHPVLHEGQPIISAPLVPASARVNCVDAASNGTKCSANWNGYTVSNGTQGLNDAYGTWNVPCVKGSGSTTAVSNWVGLGGVQENLWQGGSSWDGTNGYFLWYEAVGKHGTGSEQEIVPAHCGDTIHAQVSFSPNNPASNVSINILDVQSNTTYTKSAPSGFHSGHLTADWVDERPKCAKGLFGLADYQFSQWRDAYASANDANAGFNPIGSFTHTRLWMANNDGSGTRIAWAGALGSNNGGVGTNNYQGHWEATGKSHCE